DFVVSAGCKPFQSKQLRDLLYKKHTKSFDEMMYIPKHLRQDLKDTFHIAGCLDLKKELVSRDGTIKHAYGIAGGSIIETVLMRYKDGRNTACISSQAGCAMNCSFCATGQSGFTRNLTHEEIFEQAYNMADFCQSEGQRLSNVVFMGMGEPLNNYKNVTKAAHMMNTHLGIGAQHITISTVGNVPKIKKLATEKLRTTLAISLHTPYEDERAKIMPISTKYPICELVHAAVNYAENTNRRVTFEYCLIHGQNDSQKHAYKLARVLGPMKGLSHVNLIPLNPTPTFEGKASTEESVRVFQEILMTAGAIPSTVRVKRGVDIDAGCGQLADSLLKDIAKVKRRSGNKSAINEMIGSESSFAEDEGSEQTSEEKKKTHGDDSDIIQSFGTGKHTSDNIIAKGVNVIHAPSGKHAKSNPRFWAKPGALEAGDASVQQRTALL
ncbi:cfr family radical SAM enzyme, partial [Sphaeroforma arctica JP610]